MKRATLVSRDLKKNLMTFEIEGEMEFKFGNYIILTEDEQRQAETAVAMAEQEAYNIGVRDGAQDAASDILNR